MRIGQGYDIHRLSPGLPLVLGGVKVPAERGTKAHSDGDVLIHALCDALLGAAALGDIGQHFPDTDPRYRGISSRVFLQHVIALLQQHGYVIVNVDATILAEKPKLAPYIAAMCENLATELKIPGDAVSVKAKTMEKLGHIGAEKAIACQAIALIQKS